MKRKEKKPAEPYVSVIFFIKEKNVLIKKVLTKKASVGVPYAKWKKVHQKWSQTLFPQKKIINLRSGNENNNFWLDFQSR